MEFLDLRRPRPQELCPSDVVQCAVKISIFNLRFCDLDEGSCNCIFLVISADALFEGQEGLPFIALGQVQQSLIVFDFTGFAA